MEGQNLGHYRIESRLGAGGMGVVYLARDLRLKRPVALKLLNERLLLDPDARADLLQEGRSASALNHPNICTVHEVEEIDGQTFIVMEFVEGSLLNKLVPTSGLAVELVLRYGIQIAEALDHAHERGVVHSDLKSANVIIAPGGRAKVLDFGLARRVVDKLNDETTKTGVSLEGGRLVTGGTLSYMAPEILRGEPSSPSTDIWALGVLLYEISAGRLPFAGGTAFEVTAAILREPAPPMPAHVPPAVRAVILRCLAKDAGQRYRRAGEVRAALEAIDSSVSVSRAPLVVDLPERRVRSWRVTGMAALALAVLAAAGFGAWRYLGTRTATGTAPVTGERFKPLVQSEGRFFDPTISSDSRMVAYVGDRPTGRLDLFLVDQRGESRVPLTDDDDREERPQFSPDLTRIAFARLRPGATARDICIIPVLGGQPVCVVERASDPAWSPDGKQLVFVHRSKPDDLPSLAVANADGSNIRTLLAPDFAIPAVFSPTWSPDAREIAFIRATGGATGQLWTIPAGGGAPRRISDDSAAVFSAEPAYSPDGKWILHTSNRSGATNIWQFPREGGAPVRLTTGPGPDVSPSIAKDGTIVFSNTRWRNVLLLYDLAAGTPPVTLKTHTPYLWGPAFSPSGDEIAYAQGEFDGLWHIWVIPTKGGTPTRLTSGNQGEIYARYTPSGDTVLFHNWNEPRRIWLIPAAGGPPTQWSGSQGPDDGYADVSPKTGMVAFVRTQGQSSQIYLAPLAGGAARRLFDGPGAVPRWSPDGEWIAFSPSRVSTAGVWVIRPDGAGMKKLTERGAWPIWFPDSKRIAYMAVGADGNQVVEVVSLAGGAPTVLKNLRFEGSNHPIAISPNGKLLATANSVHLSDEIWSFKR